MSQMFDKRDPFEQRSSTTTMEPQDAAATQKQIHIDLSTLSDRDRAYYMTYGKLPPIDEHSNPELVDMAKKADEMLADFKPTEEPVQPTNTTAVNPITAVTNNYITDAEVFAEHPITPDVDKDEEAVVTNWDNPITVTPAPLEKVATSVEETKQEIPVPTLQEVPTPTPVEKEVKETPVSTVEKPTPTVTEKIADIATKKTDTSTTNETVIEVHTDTDHTQQTTTSANTTVSENTTTDTPKVEDAKKDDTEAEYIVKSEDIEDTPETVDYGYIAPDENYRIVYNNLRDSINKLSANYDTENEAEIEEYNNVLTNPNGEYFKQQMLNGVTTASRDYDQKAINDVKDFGKLQDTIPDISKPKNSSSKIDTSNLKGDEKIVKGKQAKMLVLAKLRGTKRVPLANSGFYIDVRPLTNLELSEYINTIYTENSDYGRTLGGHFYLYASMFIKKFFAERLTKIVVGSNLQGWTQGNTLQDNLSLQDFRTLMWACADLMFKDGVEFTKICAFCSHVEKVTMNLSKLYFVNHPAMSRALEYISQKKTMTPDDCAEYRSRLEFGIPHSFKLGEWNVVLQVPSLSQYLIYANMFQENLKAHVENVSNNTETQQFVRNTHFRQYAPWIKEISSMEEDGSVGFKLAYPEDIFENVDSIFEDSKEFLEKMEEYIRKTMLTYIAFPYIACPKCGKVPTNIQNGFVAYDIESAFFTMSVRKSQEISSRLRDSTAI